MGWMKKCGGLPPHFFIHFTWARGFVRFAREHLKRLFVFLVVSVPV
jgi:hypothetical protein